MEEITENEKKGLMQKYREFQKMGLESYGRYLQDELAYSGNKENRKAYVRYIENEIKKIKVKIEEVSKKI